MARRTVTQDCITRLVRKKLFVKRRGSISCFFTPMCHQKKKIFNLPRDKFSMVGVIIYKIVTKDSASRIHTLLR